MADEEERERILELVEKIDFFKGFTTYEKKRIAGHHAHFLNFPKGSLLIREGTLDTAFFILVAGQVKVLKGDGLELALLGPGEFFGELAFLTNMTRSTNVVAATDVIAIRVDQPLLGQLSAEIREKIKDRLIDKMADRLVNMTQRFLEVSPESA